ncbi:hypothetical protein [Naumannella halotolerans]|uniref:Uncharacterized protein n=1 Tax=Naumannella halotolerans TaxID=993414 RepID=A0A4R7J4U5_9ACTN|nr:hypothetical protein [Naumannella halotolerans]TDT31347.1 hypothetical protein CLV29_2766 [Naumannella halotolerans]
MRAPHFRVEWVRETGMWHASGLAEHGPIMIGATPVGALCAALRMAEMLVADDPRFTDWVEAGSRTHRAIDGGAVAAGSFSAVMAGEWLSSARLWVVWDLKRLPAACINQDPVAAMMGLAQM